MLVKDVESRDRVMPQSPEIEQALLGALMLDPDCFARVSQIVSRETFYLDQHRLIYQAMVDLKMRGLQPDLPSVLDEIKRQGQLDKCGGAGFLASLLGGVSTSAHVEFHANMIAEKHVLRRLIRTCTEIVDAGYKQDLNPTEMFDWAEKSVMDVTRSGQRGGGYMAIGESLDGVYQQAVDRHAAAGESHTYRYDGLPIGFRDHDRITRGWVDGSLNVIGGYAKSGKSMLAINIAYNVAKRGGGVLYFSLEMAHKYLTRRLLTRESGISTYRIAEGRIETDDEWLAVDNAARALGGLPIYINDAMRSDVKAIRSAVRKAISEKPISLVIVDYLQLVSTQGREMRYERVSRICGELTELATETGVPVLALSQISRQGHKDAEGGCPDLSALKETGSIEADCSTASFIWGRKTELMANATVDHLDMNLTLKANRHGGLGNCPLRFYPQKCLFEGVRVGAPGGSQPNRE